MRILDDIHYGLRSVGRSWLFFLGTAALLGLGIAANTIVAASSNALLWGDLPYQNPSKLVYLFEAYPGQDPQQGVPVSVPTFEDWRVYCHSFEELAMTWMASGPNVLLQAEPERIESYGLTTQLAHLLGVQPAMGRLFSQDEERPGGDNKVVLLQHDFWRQHLGGDADIVGKRLRMADGTYTVVGVMPEGFVYPPFTAGRYRADVWFPAAPGAEAQLSLKRRAGMVMGRLRPGVSIDSAREEMRQVAERIARENPSSNDGWGTHVSLVQRRFTERSAMRPVLLILGIAVGAVMALTCMNAALLLTVRARKRRNEVAIRFALGARRGAIIRSLLVEAFVLAVLSTGIGLVAAWGGLSVVERLIPAELPRVTEFTIGWNVAGLTLSLGVIAPLLASGWPAIALAMDASGKTMRAAAHPGRGSKRFGALVIAAQVAAAMILVSIGATALQRFDSLLEASLRAYPSASLLTLQLEPNARSRSSSELRLFHQELISKMEAVAGIDSVAMTSELPLVPRQYLAPVSVGTAPPVQGVRETSSISAKRLAVTPRFFQTVGAPMLSGREFSSADTMGAPVVAVINETLASRLGLDGKPGRQIWIGDKPHEVVGVAPDRPVVFGVIEPMIYLSINQLNDREGKPMPEYSLLLRESGVLIRSSLPLPVLQTALRRAVWSVDGEQPIAVAPMTSGLQRVSAPERLTALVLGCFACVAVLLAAAGVYGTIAYEVNRRSRDIAVTTALGATPWQVSVGVLRRAIYPTAVGVVVGLLLIVTCQGAILSLAGIPQSVSSEGFVAGAVAALMVAVCASIAPIRRALRYPVAALLRCE